MKRYVYGQRSERSTVRFAINMILIDVIIVLLILIARNLYYSQMVTHDIQLIERWCQTVLCIYVDPQTGIGTSAVPQFKVEEI
jgi:hypothetical protein